MAASLRLLRFTIRLGLVVGWAWFIYDVSSDASPSGPSAGGAGLLDFLPRPDLFAHAGVYAIFAWLLMLLALPIKFCKPINIALHFLMPIIIVFVYGLAMEMVQDGIPERSAEALDVVADVVGALITIVFMVKVWPRIKRARRAVAAHL